MSRARFAVLGFLFFAGCATSREPSDPVWGKQPCDACKMIIGDRRYAAELVTPDGERRFFDDVGCLASYLASHHEEGVAWVRTEGGKWEDARRARYVSGVHTPMDYGFAETATGTVDFATVTSAVAAKETRR